MIVTCPACASRYSLADERIGDGRNVRCTGCGETWFARPEQQEAGMQEPETLERSGEPAAGAPDMAGDAMPGDAIPALSETEEAPPPGPAVDSDGPLLQMADVAPVTRGRLPADRPNPAPRRRRARLSPDARSMPLRRLLAVSVGAALALAVIGVIERASVVAMAPGLASFYERIGLPVNLRGLAFHNVTSRSEFDDGVPVLAVEGEIENVTSDEIAVPTLRLSLRGAKGEEIYAWTAPPPVARVGAGQTVRFSSKLTSPPQAARDVFVRFSRGGERMAGSF